MSRRKYLCMVGILLLCLTGCSETDVTDQFNNVVQADNENVLRVKEGTNLAHPGKSYGEAFESFFEYPTWKYFKGVKEGLDENGDGEPDSEEANVDIVEFTGYCLYKDVKVKALIQFTLDSESDVFEATYLSFNDIPQDNFTLYSLLDTVFGQEGEDNTAENDVSKETVTSTQNNKFYVGDKIEFNSGMDISILDAGKMEISDFDGSVIVCTYLTIRVENNGDENISVSTYDFECYCDEYRLERGDMYTESSTWLGTVNLSPGRKAEGNIYFLCPDYDMAVNIEAEIGDAIIVIKEGITDNSSDIENGYEQIIDDTITEQYYEEIPQFNGVAGYYQTGSDPESGIMDIYYMGNGMASVSLGTGEMPEIVRGIECQIVDENTMIGEIYWEQPCQLVFTWSDKGEVTITRTVNTGDEILDSITDNTTYFCPYYYNAS